MGGSTGLGSGSPRARFGIQVQGVRACRQRCARSSGAPARGRGGGSVWEIVWAEDAAGAGGRQRAGRTA